jgi:hypothetical protein
MIYRDAFCLIVLFYAWCVFLQAAGTAPKPIYGLWYAKVEGEPEPIGLCATKGRVFISSSSSAAAGFSSIPPQAASLERQQGHSFVTEKNWMYFETALKEKLFVTEVEPRKCELNK